MILSQASGYKQIIEVNSSHNILMAESEGEGVCVDEKGVLLPAWFYLSSKPGSTTHGFEPISHGRARNIFLMTKRTM